MQKLDTGSTKTKCLKLHYQEQMPHQNKMKDIGGKIIRLFRFTPLDRGSGNCHFQSISLVNLSILGKKHLWGRGLPYLVTELVLECAGRMELPKLKLSKHKTK